MKNIIYIALLICSFGFSQQTPGKKQSTPITIVGATAHIGNGTVIENSLLIFENSKLIVVARRYN